MISRQKTAQIRKHGRWSDAAQHTLLSDRKISPHSMKQALSTPAIWPAFQPLVDMQSGALVGFEVLARWTDSEAGIIPPSTFIPVAEANDLIDALTKKIVSEACELANLWPGNFVLAINISAVQFRDPNLFEFIRSIVQATGFPLNRIHIEITESVLLEDDETVRSTIALLKSAGIGLALDDFGTGFASLTRLHAFPFDKLKIDMSFVRSMQHDNDSRKIVASVVGLGQSLGMVVVAEGVETEEQATILRRLGCDLGQGWLFGKPLNGAETAQWLAYHKQQSLSQRAGSVSLFQRVHQLDALYRAAPIGLCFLDMELRYVSVNDRFAEMFGLCPDDLIGRTVHSFAPDHDAPRVAGDLRRVLAGETVVINEYQPAGSEKAFLVINQPVDDDGGEQIGISVTAIDVTDRKTVETVLRETEDHARRSVELNASIPWSSDAKGVVNFMGPTLDGMADSTVDRIADWYRRMHPDDRLRVRQEWFAWLPSGKPFETMFRMRLHDDAWRWMLSRAKPHRDSEGKIVKWYGVITAVADRDGFEPKIELFGTSTKVWQTKSPTGMAVAPWRPTAVKHELNFPDSGISRAASVTDPKDVLPTELLVSMLMRMFESAPIAMSITTSDTKTSSYVKVNEAYLRLTGLKWDDIKGKKLTSEGAAIDNPARDRRHRLLEEEGAYELEEVDITYADGTIIPTLISAQRTVIDGVSFDVEIILDVSARVRQQREIENALKTSARTDALSGLPNRACFDEVVADAVARNLLNDRKLALAYIDLNDFKIVNDTIGHSAGDEVLRTIANRLRENFRATDFIARIGGDEFVVLLDIDRKLAGDLQSHLQETMERIFKPIPIDGQVTFTGAAVGVTFLRADDTVQSYVKRADEYMYIAKTSGERVAVVCFGQILDPSALSKHTARQTRLS
ncbi:EAL domain-containing protein [Rhizobium sp. IMFF44]|uniref:EAL domain-containing protein n=1 Tax=unclassified Rhizobium TaxID=2613769 RepID=UPI0035B70C42